MKCYTLAMDRSKVTIISIFITIFLAIIAFLASIIFSAPQTVPAENGAQPVRQVPAAQQ